MESGEDIEEDKFASGKRMMNWKEERNKNLWIVERSNKRRKRDEETKIEGLGGSNNPTKKRKMEVEGEIQAEKPGKETVLKKDNFKVKDDRKTKLGGKKSQPVQGNILTNYFSGTASGGSHG